MYLIGLNRDAETGAAHMAILEKGLKGLKRHYRLAETAHWPPDTPEATVGAALVGQYADPRWTVRRKVFSQDRRPAKNVRTPPLIAARFGLSEAGRSGGPEIHRPDTRSIDALRARNLPLEGVAVTREAAWRREDFGALRRGNNYFVPGPDLETVLRRVFSQGRLTLDPACPMADRLAPGPPETFSYPIPNPTGESSEGDLWLAVSLPVWFSETVRKIARYGDA